MGILALKEKAENKILNEQAHNLENTESLEPSNIFIQSNI